MFDFLPAADAVTLTPAPLQQVIVQVKFDRQERLSQHGGVSAMHDLLGGVYPRLLSEPQTMVTAGPAGVTSVETPQWRLADLDGQWSVVVNAESVAVSTTAYVRWEDTRVRLLAMLDALTASANPRTRERVGLRYLNHIPADDDGRFHRRVRPELLGVGAIPGWEQHLAVSLNQDVLRDGNTQLAVRHGLGGGVIAPDGVFVLDLDCASEVPVLYDGDATLALLDDLNDASWRCFSSLIHDDYRHSMGGE